MVSCQDLAQELSGLQSRLSHVVDDTARQDLIKRISAVELQQERQGCLEHVVRILNGVATLWNDSGLLSSPRQNNIQFTLTIFDVTGDVQWFFTPLKVDSATVQIDTSVVSGGTFIPSSGELGLNAGVLVTNVPIVGIGTGALFLSTSDTITPPGSPKISGRPVSSNGAVQLVGQGPIDTSIKTVNAWLSITGILGLPK
jgi:hypothetical protein